MGDEALTSKDYMVGLPLSPSNLQLLMWKVEPANGRYIISHKWRNQFAV